jgi:hypothetical protein
VLDARHPRTVVGVVVLRSERLQAEARTGQTLRDHEVIRDERADHLAELTRRLLEAVPLQSREQTQSSALSPTCSCAAFGGDRVHAKPIPLPVSWGEPVEKRWLVNRVSYKPMARLPWKVVVGPPRRVVRREGACVGHRRLTRT